MKKLLNQLINNELLLLFLVILSIVQCFPEINDSLNHLLGLVGLNNVLLQKVLCTFVIFIFWLFIIWIFSLFKSNNYKLLANFSIQPDVYISPDSSGDRINDFRKIRIDAKKSIFVMGIGMTFFSNDKTLLDSLLSKGIKVRLLMINPEIIKKYDCDNICKIKFGDSYFDSYFDRTGYTSEVESSYKRLCEYVKKKSTNSTKGDIQIKNIDDKTFLNSINNTVSIELKKYFFFYPFNFTIIDENEKKGSKMLFEFALPFSENRVRLKLNRNKHSNFYENIINACEKMWDNAELVIKSESNGI